MEKKNEYTLTTLGAYRAMVFFLEKYYNNTKSDEIAGFLGSMSISEDGKPMDSALWDEWLEAIKNIENQN